MKSTQTDVVIAGAGPTGLLLAGDLAAAGVRCTVLERRTDESNLTRAFGVHARTLERLDARGLADEVIATGSPVGSVWLFDNTKVDLTVLPSRFPYLLITPQYEVERIPQRRAIRRGADIVYGAEVIDVPQDADAVDIDASVADGVETSGRVMRSAPTACTAPSAKLSHCRFPAIP